MIVVSANITPTVELNALAMKRGEPAIYKLIDPPHPQQVYQPQPAYSYRRPYGVSISLEGIKASYEMIIIRKKLVLKKRFVGHELGFGWKFFKIKRSPCIESRGPCKSLARS